MLRIIRLMDAAALSAVALWVAACSDSAAPTAPTAQFRTELVTCEASVPAGTLTCASSQPQTGRPLQAAPGMSFDLILGGQGALVRLASSGTAYNAGTQAFTSNVTVENLIAQPMNTTNGTTPDAGGIKVFFHSGPTVTGGTGTVTIANADGTGSFTGASQPYFLYSSGAVLASGATTSAKNWQFTVPTTVTTFAFQVFVTTRLPDEISALVALGLSRSPSALTIVKGENGSTTVALTRTNFTGAVTLGLTGAPTGVTGGFTPAAPTGTSANLTVNVSYLATPGDYNLTVTGTGSAGNRSTRLTLTVSASGISDIATLDAGDYHSCALRASGVAYCWGDNGNGQLGDGTTTQRLVPTPVAGSLTFSSLSAGGALETCGVTPGGAAYCWGNNAYGQLGDGTTTERLVPTPVAGGLTFASVHAGAGPPRIASAYSCGVTSSGAAYCWGTNFYGQLGDGTQTQRLVPTAVVGGLTFTTLSVGAAHTCGLTTSGAAYCWGFNGDGRLGDNTTTQRLVPTAVAGGLTFASVTAGDFFTCAVTTSGAAYCWGAGGYIGDGTTTQRLVPTSVAGGLTFASVNAAAGTGFTNTAYSCGVTTSGDAYCWGYNTFGTLGDGTTTQRLVPNTVAGGLTFADVRAGGNHTCGVTTSGAAYCWGLNGNGELGDGTTTERLVPMPVSFPTPP